MQRAILFVMLGFLFAGFAVMVMASLNDGRQPEPASSEHEPSILFPDAALLRFAAYLPVAAFIAGGATLPLILLIQRLQIDSPWLVVPVFAVIPILGLHAALAAVIRCPRCQLRLILKRQSRPRFGEPTKNRNAWGALLHRIRKEGRFRCMFCGQRYHLGN